MTVPFAPTIVRTGGKPILSYELHLTNLTREAFTLTDVAVVGDGRGALAS